MLYSKYQGLGTVFTAEHYLEKALAGSPEDLCYSCLLNALEKVFFRDFIHFDLFDFVIFLK